MAGVWQLLLVTTRQCTGAQSMRDNIINHAAATGDAGIPLT